MGKQLLAAMILSFLFQGCHNNGMEIGNNWVTVHTRVLQIDTCTVEISSVLLDSVPTSGGGRIFAGIRRSELWGETKASTFMTFNITSDYEYDETFDSRQNVFDSLTVYMVPDIMFSGDTLKPAKLGIYRLSERLQLNDYGELYGHSFFNYDPTPLAVYSFYPGPLRGKEMEIRLPDELGREFLDKLASKDDDMEYNENFQKYFRGVMLAPDPSCQAITAFKGADSICMMKLYYHTTGDYPKECILNFKLNANTMFTRIESDRTGTSLDGISFKNNEIPSEQTDNKAFIQGMTGIYTRIFFPYLNNIRGLGDYGAIVSAKLVVYPLAGSYHKQNYSALSENLQLYISNDMNETIGAVAGTDSDVQIGILTYDSQFSDKTYYSFDVTSFIKEQLGKIGVNKRTLQMLDGNYGYTLNDLVMANQTDDRKNIELHITYSIFNEE